MRILLFLPAGAILLITTACGDATRVAAAPKPLEVLVAEVQQKDVPIYREWIGTLDGLVNADIKAQVSGYLVQQAYTEGTFVKQGPIAVSDRSAALSGSAGSGAGQLAQAGGPVGTGARAIGPGRSAGGRRRSQSAPHPARRGSLHAALPQQQAITQQDLDNATQNNMAAKAQVQAAQAQVETAKAQITAASAAVSPPRPRSKRRRSTSDSRDSPRPSTAFPESRSCRSALW